MTAIADVLWTAMQRMEPTSELGGILARKPGYHNSRDHLPATDYSVSEFAVDREGDATLGSAIDWTFPEAQHGDYARIMKYSKRLYAALSGNDPRAYAIREFFGNTNGDSTVDGYDNAKNCPSYSDSSHLWHIHISIHRKWNNDVNAMHAIADILAGIPVAPPVPKPPLKPRLTRILRYVVPMMSGADVRYVQTRLRIGADGWYGPQTKSAVLAFQRTHGLSVDGIVGPLTWAKL